jgi:ubiquinone/menaquinone biosynthesis C-methylase UbiE
MPHERMFHHAHADRLDDPERRTWLPPDDVVRALGLKPGDRVADIGAGSGYFAIPLAQAVGQKGRVAAVDLQPEMLDRLRAKLSEHRGLRVDCVQGDAVATTLEPAGEDLVFCANVWHELDDRPAALAEFARILRPDGRLAILDWRPDVESPPGPPLDQRIDPSEVRRTLDEHGWRVTRSSAVGRYSYLIVAHRPGA